MVQDCIFNRRHYNLCCYTVNLPTPPLHLKILLSSTTLPIISLQDGVYHVQMSSFISSIIQRISKLLIFCAVISNITWKLARWITWHEQMGLVTWSFSPNYLFWSPAYKIIAIILSMVYRTRYFFKRSLSNGGSVKEKSIISEVLLCSVRLVQRQKTGIHQGDAQMNRFFPHWKSVVSVDNL